MKRSVALILALMLVMTMFGSTALAAKKTASTSSVTTLQTGKWYSATNEKYLKIKFKTDSLITASWKNNTEDYLFLFLFLDSAGERLAGQFLFEDKASGSVTLAVQKGTYYIRSSNMGSTAKVKFAWSKLSDAKNYCPSRATIVKKKVKTRCGAHTPMNSGAYDWFKIEIAKPQKITVSVQATENDYSLFIKNSELKYVETESYGKAVSKTVKKVPAGTYFICFAPHSEFSRYARDTFTFTWK